MKKQSIVRLSPSHQPMHRVAYILLRGVSPRIRSVIRENNNVFLLVSPTAWKMLYLEPVAREEEKERTNQEFTNVLRVVETASKFVWLTHIIDPNLRNV